MTLAAHLRGAFRHEWQAPKLILTFDTEMMGQVGIIEKGDKKDVLDQAIADLYGPDVKLVFKIQEDPGRLKQEADVQAMHKEVENHPIVMMTKEIFHAKILKIEKRGKS